MSFAALLFVLLWSTGFLAGKGALPYADPFVLIAIRMAIAAVVVACLIPVFRQRMPRKASEYAHICVSGLLLHVCFQGGIFYAIHNERQALDTQDSIAMWADKQGLDRAKFLELYNSFSVSTKARRGTQLQEAFKVQGVPSLGVAGRFYTDGSLAQTMERALAVTDYLIAEVRKGR